MSELTPSRELSGPQIEYLASQRLGRIATAGADRKPHVVPTSFRYNAGLGTVDVGGIHVADTKKYRDVQGQRLGGDCRRRSRVDRSVCYGEGRRRGVAGEPGGSPPG